jgi:hypothetical protein
MQQYTLNEGSSDCKICAITDHNTEKSEQIRARIELATQQTQALEVRSLSENI